MHPSHITFTGVDRRTDLTRMRELSDQYPCEWGVLFSRNRQGMDNRYPDIETLNNILAISDSVKLAAHVCGKFAQEIMMGDFAVEVPFVHFERVQVNHVAPSPSVLADFAKTIECEVIAQWRDAKAFPEVPSAVSWLYDASGGRGTRPKEWPTNPTYQIVGYAGGINPENVKEINEIARTSSPSGYWLDMETGVRTDDWFDLDKIEAVLKEVFG